jgi:glycosyltransferase involved in cell wall biosynthesis
MTNSDPLVSVIVPAFNAVTTIERALRSIQIQDYDNLEVFVVDDASVDGTGDLVSRFDGVQVTLLQSDETLGASGARNLAIDASRGEYLAFLDADDEWLAGKLKAQVQMIVAHPDAVFVTCEADLLAPGGLSLGRINPDRERPQGRDGWKMLLRHPCVATPCVLARRDKVVAIGSFNRELASGEDQDLWIRLAMLGSVEHIDEVYVNVYDTGFSLSKRERTNSAGAILPIVIKGIDDNRADLTDDEVHTILAHRYRSTGRIYAEVGRYKEAARYLGQASKKGLTPLGNLSYLIKATPPVRRLKHLVSPPRLGGEHKVTLDEETRPGLIVVVDTEEEFDWSKPFSASNRSIESILYQDETQSLFETYGIKPTYVLDYPIVENQKSVAVIKRYFEKNSCMIGAHLQPWVNPPYLEEQSNFNSYPGNLSFRSEYLKLKELTELIETEFSHRPTSYKAGRYGFGPSTPKILKTLGYQIDLSVVPHTDFSKVEGFDFSSFANEPVWLGDDLDLLEVPLTRGFAGMFASLGPRIFRDIDSPLGVKLHLPGLLARAGLLERITLTPEGISLEEMKRLTRKMLSRGRRIFCLTYHSSTLMPGGSPYVTTEEDRQEFVSTIKRYLEFFFDECGGQPCTPDELRRQALAPRSNT